MMMSEPDWAMILIPGIYRNYPTPIRHLSVSDGRTLNLGRTQLRYMPTPGVLSTGFTVCIDGYPHQAFLFGGTGLNFDRVQAAGQYLQSTKRIQQIEGIQVHVRTHAKKDEIFTRRDRLLERGKNRPHPLADPDSWSAC